MSEKINFEEILVAELELLGIRYLSRQTTYNAKSVRPYPELFADLILQPDSRVRTAIIGVLISHPETAHSIPLAMKLLDADKQYILKLFYTAAVALQKEYVHQLKSISGENLVLLPDLFSIELNIPNSVPTKEILKILGQKQSQYTKVYLNWEGTYRNVVNQLIHRWELETKWQG